MGSTALAPHYSLLLLPPLHTSTITNPIRRLFLFPTTDALATSHHHKPRPAGCLACLACTILIGATTRKHGTQRGCTTRIHTPFLFLSSSLWYHTPPVLVGALGPRMVQLTNRSHRIPASSFEHSNATLACVGAPVPLASGRAVEGRRKKKTKFAFRLLDQQQPRHDCPTI
jgi:hypothetical protein